MTSGELLVDEFYPVSFEPGLMVVGQVQGDLAEGDIVELTRPDGTVARGEIVVVHIHQRTDEENVLRVGLGGEAADVVQPGDRLLAVDDSPGSA